MCVCVRAYVCARVCVYLCVHVYVCMHTHASVRTNCVTLIDLGDILHVISSSSDCYV